MRYVVVVLSACSIRFNQVNKNKVKASTYGVDVKHILIDTCIMLYTTLSRQLLVSRTYRIAACPSAANGPCACPTTATTAACSPPGLATMLALSLRLYRACPLVWTIPNLSIITRCCAFLLLLDANSRGASHRFGAFLCFVPAKSWSRSLRRRLCSCCWLLASFFPSRPRWRRASFKLAFWMLRCVELKQ